MAKPRAHAIRRAIALFHAPVEPLEDARLVLLSDARALVNHANHRAVAILVFGCGHADHAIFLGIADGVFDELVTALSIWSASPLMTRSSSPLMFSCTPASAACGSSRAAVALSCSITFSRLAEDGVIGSCARMSSSKQTPCG